MSSPLVAGVRLVTADDVCVAVEGILTAHLPDWAAAAELEQVTTWQQVPTVQAVSSAAVPAGAITSPGLTAPPTKHGDRHEATWRVAVAVYDRGSSYSDTARRVRVWAALVRAVLVQHPRLGGLALRLHWVGEEYELVPDQGARTLGGCAVAVDVVVADVVAATAPPSLGGPPPAPTVTATRSTVTVRPTTPQE